MFSRIREASKIIGYREPVASPDAVIVERQGTTSSRAGRVISGIIEAFVGIYCLAWVAGRIGENLHKIIPPVRSVSIPTVAAAVGALLVMLVHFIWTDIQKKIRTRMNLAALLAPYFGHRLDHSIRVLKG